MRDTISNIKVIVWDLDGTLYKSNEELCQALHKAFIKLLADFKNISPTESEVLLTKTKEIYKSTTKSLFVLGCGDSVSIIDRVEKAIDKTSYLTVDRKLQELFVHLSSYKHMIISDTLHHTIVAELEAMGLSQNLFSEIIGVDDVQGVKPDLLMFRKALSSSGLAASAHLMVGDRVEVDLVPAKIVGMKTCLVWGNQVNIPGVDFSLADVYKVADLFKHPAPFPGN